MRRLLINSHAQSEIPRSTLLKTLQVCTPERDLPVVVVIGGSTERDRHVDGVQEIHVPYNAIDFTALIALGERSDYDEADEFFYVHDTCVVRPDFIKNVLNIQPLDEHTMSRRVSYPSCNMGLYRYSLIKQHASRLAVYRQPRNLQELKAICVRDEDLLFKLDPGNTMTGRGITAISQPTDFYGTGTMRRIEEYGDLGLCKIKANWYVKKTWALLP